MISKEKFRDIKPGDMIKIDTDVDKVKRLEIKYEHTSVFGTIYGMVDDMIPPTKGHWAKVRKVISTHGVLFLEPIDGSDVASYAYTRYCILEVIKAKDFNAKKPDAKKPDAKKPEAKKPDTKKPEAKKPDVKEDFNKVSEVIHMFISKHFPDKPCMLVADYPNGGQAKEGGIIKIMTDME